MKRSLCVAAGASLLLTTSCSGFFTRFAAKSTVGVLKNGTPSFDEETDPWLAKTAAAGNLKFFEGILKTIPDNEDLLVITAKSYALYAFAFIEDEMETVPFGSDAWEALKARATNFYSRGKAYTTRVLAAEFEDFEKAIDENSPRLDEILAECDEDQIAPLYWFAYSWGSVINLQQDPELLAQLPKVKKIMAWVRDRQGDYENGGPWLFFGALEMALPKELGGNPDASKAAFDKGIAMTDGKFLMGKALYAKFTMLPTNNKAEYVRLLQEVIDTPSDVMPSQYLANELAKIRARRWLADADNVFMDETPAPAAEETPAPAEPAPGQ